MNELSRIEWQKLPIYLCIGGKNVIELKMMSHIRSEPWLETKERVELSNGCHSKDKSWQEKWGIFHILWMCFFEVEIVFMYDMLLYAVYASWCMTLIFPLFNSLMGNLLSFILFPSCFIPAIIFTRELDMNVNVEFSLIFRSFMLANLCKTFRQFVYLNFMAWEAPLILKLNLFWVSYKDWSW